MLMTQAAAAEPPAEGHNHQIKLAQVEGVYGDYRKHPF